MLRNFEIIVLFSFLCTGQTNNNAIQISILEKTKKDRLAFSLKSGLSKSERKDQSDLRNTADLACF